MRRHPSVPSTTKVFSASCPSTSINNRISCCDPWKRACSCRSKCSPHLTSSLELHAYMNSSVLAGFCRKRSIRRWYFAWTSCLVRSSCQKLWKGPENDLPPLFSLSHSKSATESYARKSAKCVRKKWLVPSMFTRTQSIGKACVRSFILFNAIATPHHDPTGTQLTLSSCAETLPLQMRQVADPHQHSLVQRPLPEGNRWLDCNSWSGLGCMLPVALS
mmetsp:Transcript_20411/g.47592  ORF Transcript_20411/g.47592 Transcript_20411/m.47592 type:complete len:218 (-) Transcript_20411:29-682(-)